jgi:hypothetical protein
MKYKKLSILAAGAAVVATALAPIANVSAWDITPTGDAVVYVTRKVENVSGLVNATFTYHITPDDSNPAEVSPISDQTITLSDVDGTSGNAYYTGTIDFSGVSFSKIGDYAFLIEETASSDESNYPHSENKYYAHFYVRNSVDDNGNITGHEAHYGYVTSEYVNGSKVNNVDSNTENQVVFTAGTNRTYITFDKTVVGTGADADLCFAFDVTFTGRSDLNYVFDSETDCTGNPATVSGGDTTTVYIKSGDTARIGYNGGSTQIPIGADYSITETGDDSREYETYIDNSTNDSKSISKTTVATNSENFNTANKTSYVNKKDTPAPTGVMLSILPFVLIALAGIGGAFYVAKNRKVTE